MLISKQNVRARVSTSHFWGSANGASKSGVDKDGGDFSGTPKCMFLRTERNAWTISCIYFLKKSFILLLFCLCISVCLYSSLCSFPHYFFVYTHSPYLLPLPTPPLIRSLFYITNVECIIVYLECSVYYDKMGHYCVCVCVLYRFLFMPLNRSLC